EWRPYREARRSPGVGVGVAARRGADVDSFKDRMREVTARLYRELEPEIDKALKREGIDHVILVGTPAAMSAFEETLNAGQRERIAARLAPPANPAAEAHEWLPLVKDVIDEGEAKRELKLLETVRETGVT